MELFWIIFALVTIISIVVVEKRHDQNGKKFSEIISKCPDEKTIDTIISGNFFANKEQNLTKLSSSAAKIILINYDSIIVITDLAFYHVFSHNNQTYRIKEFLRTKKLLATNFHSNAEGQLIKGIVYGKIYYDDCYISYDTVEKFGKPSFAISNRNGFYHISTRGASEEKIKSAVNYITQAARELHRRASNFTVEQLIQSKEQAKANQQKIWSSGTWKLPLEAFVQSCNENRIADPDSERDIQKAKLIVENLMRKEGIPLIYQSQYTTPDKLRDYISQMKQRNEAAAQAELKKQIALLKPEEQAFAEECTRYANFTGRDKSVRYCQDKIAYYSNIIWQCEQNEQSVRDGGNLLYETGKGRESSWAIHGGIASGIAGGAAGLAVAADVERKNAQVRQRNEQLLTSIARFSADALISIAKEKDRAEHELNVWRKKEEKANTLLTQSLDESDLLTQISPKLVDVENSPTGAVKLKIELHAAPNLTIFDGIEAVVDGSIRVKLAINGQNVGNARCVIKYGGATKTHVVDCICLNVFKQSEKYSVSFEPCNLWAVEKH